MPSRTPCAASSPPGQAGGQPASGRGRARVVEEGWRRLPDLGEPDAQGADVGVVEAE